MKPLYSGLFMAAGGILSGLERLLSNPKRSRRQPGLQLDETPPVAATITHGVPEAVAAAPAPQLDAKPTERNFSIKRTKSEVGYVYWILEGYGRYKCFILCDSWDEAVAQAKAKMAEVDGTDARMAASAANLA